MQLIQKITNENSNTQSGKESILSYTRPELEAVLVSMGMPRMRAAQLINWVYVRKARSFDEMTDISAANRELLKEKFIIRTFEVASKQEDKEGTSKYLFRLSDGSHIESVVMHYENRLSACLSTQVGCPIACPFCATGLDGLYRNLSVAEIVEQILALQDTSDIRINNIVFMGMGEPLLNYDNLLKAIKIIQSNVGIGMRHITISTSGIEPAIRKLADENLPLTLALSVHSADPATRDVLVPINKKYPLPQLIEAMKYYREVTGRNVTLEYVMLAGINDSEEQARQLAKISRGVIGNINIIPYNPVTETGYKRPAYSVIQKFNTILRNAGYKVTQRAEKGSTIKGACGQLRTQVGEYKMNRQNIKAQNKLNQLHNT